MVQKNLDNFLRNNGEKKMKMVLIFCKYIFVYLVGLLAIGTVCNALQVNELITYALAGFWGGIIAFTAILKYGEIDNERID